LKTYLDCVPCFLRQALNAGRMASGDEDLNEKVLRQAIRLCEGLDLSLPPPRIAREIYRMIHSTIGDGDPYRDVKRRSNEIAMEYYPQLKRRVAESPNPFETAVRLAIAGNIIDFGARDHSDVEEISESIESSLAYPIDRAVLERLESDVYGSKNMLYIGDNAGEVVFDRILIEHLLPMNITYAVRGSAVINDATMDDARDAGIAGMVGVVDSGSDIPGTILDECSAEFRRHYEAADVVIAKGQGNYETLNEEAKRIYFLLKVKCSIVARDTGAEKGAALIVEARRGG